MFRWLDLGVLLMTVGVFGSQASAQSPQPAAQAFDRLKALEGQWIDVDGAFGNKGAVAATYEVSGAGNTVVERFPVGTKYEMLTVYHRDGSDVVLTHYCTSGNQPRMRAKTLAGNVLSFDYDGGTNIDVATTSHMHSVRFEFVSADEIKAEWQNWSKGKPDHPATMRLERKR